MVTLTLKAKHHALIIGLMDDKGDARKVNYVIQVSRECPEGCDPEKQVEVTVADSLVPELYEKIGQQEERVTAIDNAEIKAALVPQLMAYPEVMAQIQALAQGNAQLTEQVRQRGFSYIRSIQP